jgi:esterase/lipase superfamily enzyme
MEKQITRADDTTALFWRSWHSAAGISTWVVRYVLTTSEPDFWNLLDGYQAKNIFENSPPHFLPRLGNADYLTNLRKVDTTMVGGDDDLFLENNRELSRILAEKAIFYRLHVWSGRAPLFHYWQQMARLYI